MRLIVAILSIAAALQPAHAAGPWRTVREGGAAGPLEARGCYWIRERQYCGRYCYTENDGRRFCRHRSYFAVPQTPQEIFEAPVDGQGTLK